MYKNPAIFVGFFFILQNMQFIKYILMLIILFSISQAKELTKIIINGNDKTKDYIIIREIHHPIPGMYNSKIADDDKNRIYNLNLFSSVNIDTMDNKYVINVSEKFYFFPLPIFDYDETTGNSYGAAILNINFRGRDETIAGGFIKGNSDQYFLYYLNPWIYGDHISFGFQYENLSASHHVYEIIDNMNIFELFSGFYIGNNHKFKFTTGYSSHQLDSNMGFIYKYLNARLSYKYDTRDIYLDPTKGMLLNFRILMISQILF